MTGTTAECATGREEASPPVGSASSPGEEDVRVSIGARISSTLGWDLSRGARRWAAGASIAAAYSIFFAVGVLNSDGSAPAKALSLVLLAAMIAGYILMPGLVLLGEARGRRLVARWLVICSVMLLVLPQLWLMGPGPAAGLLVYPALLAGILLPLRAMVPLVLGFGVAVLALTWSMPDGPGWELALTLVALSYWMAAFARNMRLTHELREARDELAQAAVLTERERIARDLHDILGHSLTAITVKAALARQLLDRAPERAGTEIADIERLARSAVTDVRATASGIREQSLAGALASGRSVLIAAGITPTLPGAIDDVVPAGRELFGYVVTEAITNVVRHSSASRCTVRLGADWVEITDDGRGSQLTAARRRPVNRDAGGTGLTGLAERVAAAGGTLTTEDLRPAGFSVRVRLDTGRQPE